MMAGHSTSFIRFETLNEFIQTGTVTSPYADLEAVGRRIQDEHLRPDDKLVSSAGLMWGIDDINQLVSFRAESGMIPKPEGYSAPIDVWEYVMPTIVVLVNDAEGSAFYYEEQVGFEGRNDGLRAYMEANNFVECDRFDEGELTAVVLRPNCE